MFATANLLNDALVGLLFVFLVENQLNYFHPSACWFELISMSSLESSKKISKIGKNTSQSLETLYCLTFLNHCSSLEPCASSCEW